VDQIKPDSEAGGSVPALFLKKVIARQDIFPQTYLFYGPQYSGKEYTALEFFKALNCSRNSDWACGECDHCLKIAALSSSDLFFLFSHPDLDKIRLFCDFFLKNPIPAIEQLLKKEIYKLLLFLNPNKSAKKNLDQDKLFEIYEKPLSPSAIKILHDFLDFAEGLARNVPVELVRTTLEKIYLSPYELKYKLLLIKDCADLNQESANTLLKTIEEPPINTIIIMLTTNLGRILPTIRSRAMKLKFKPYSGAQIEKISQAMHRFPFAQLLNSGPQFSFLINNLTELTQSETVLLIDWLKKGTPYLSPLGKEKYVYLNELKSGLLFYNLPLSSVKNALKVLLDKLKP